MPQHSKQAWVALVLIVLFGFYLRFVTIAETEIDNPLRADASEYFLSAYNLVNYGVYSLSRARLKNPDAEIKPDDYRWPGYPLIIAAFMWEWPNQALLLRDLQWVNLLAGTATVALIGVATMAALPSGYALAATFITAISPHLLSFTVYLLTDTIAAFFLALLLAMFAWPIPDRDSNRRVLVLLLGLVTGLLALVRPLFAALPLFLVMALPGPATRLKDLVLLFAGVFMCLAPWLVRNELSVPSGITGSYLGATMLGGAYPDYMLNGDPNSFPYAYVSDPDFPKAAATLGSALVEIGRRIAADPVGMARWYLLRKPLYLWQFDNIDGVGDVYIYPVIRSPFSSNALFRLIHAVMHALHWPLVVLGALGAALVWLPRAMRRLPERRSAVLRAMSLLLVFTTLATFPTMAVGRFAVPVYPALFVMAMVPLLLGGRILTADELADPVDKRRPT